MKREKISFKIYLTSPVLMEMAWLGWCQNIKLTCQLILLIIACQQHQPHIAVAVFRNECENLDLTLHTPHNYHPRSPEIQIQAITLYKI